MHLYEIDIQKLPKTAPRTLNMLRSLGVHTYADLINYIPFRYENYAQHVTIKELAYLKPIPVTDTYELVSNVGYTITGIVTKFDSISTRRGLTMQKVAIEDETGKTVLTYFNQPYLRQLLKVGTQISVSGQIKETSFGVSFQPNDYEVLAHPDIQLHTGRIIPVYQQTRGISSKTIREKIWYVLSHYSQYMTDMLPPQIMETYKLEKAPMSYQHIHFPESVDKLLKARDTKAFEEFFTIQLSSQIIKKEWDKQRVTFRMNLNNHRLHIDEFIHSLPFHLTTAQTHVLEDILENLESQKPMNRLLQGDVGSGKTVVAAAAAYAICLSKLKTIIMAPTEILAQQHALTFARLFEHLLIKKRPKIILISRSSKPSDQDLKDADFIIGTHALLSKKVSYENVGLVIIDEQHKFGVEQRAELTAKGASPHVLSMTATPIPRTVTLTMYGELDISIIDELPKGRIPISSYTVPPKKRSDAYSWIEKELKTHKTQAFIICPLIDESEAESLQNTKAAKAEYERLQRDIFPDLRLGLLHGRLKKDEKESVMSAFAAGEYDILVSTPVVEVGIDIPNATIIVIEAAERFGLAQLHQLRGRVGRSDKQSHCLLFTETQSVETKERLKMFTQTQNGFVLAEYDLKNRGGGTVYGTRQHGQDFFHVASFLDTDLMKKTKMAAAEFIQQDIQLADFPELEKSLKKYQTSAIAAN